MEEQEVALRPRGKWTLIRRVSADEEKGEARIILPEKARKAMQSKTKARVVAKGPETSDDYDVGSVVLVNPTGCVQIDVQEGWFLVHDEAVLGVF